MTDIKILPEALCTDSICLSNVELGSPVSGIAIRFDSHSREIIVDLGYGMMGIIPEDEATIYEPTFPEGRCTPYEISSIIGKKIRAIVTCYQKDGFLLLSRKLSMLEAWEVLKVNTIVSAIVIAVCKTGVFIDVGNGLVSYIPISECSSSRYKNIDSWFKPGDHVFVKILTKNETDDYIITSSRKDAYPTLEEDPTAVYVNDIIAVRVSTKLPGGYFCEYTPGIPGIFDTSNEYSEGEMVKGAVKKITPKGIKVKLFE